MSLERASNHSKSTVPARAHKVLEIPCVTCDKILTLTGQARSNALRPGKRTYCPPPAVCGKIGRRTKPRTRKALEIDCATCGKHLTLTGKDRKGAIRPGRKAYCPPPAECTKIGKSEGMKAANRIRWADPVYVSANTGRRHSPETKAKQSVAKVAQYADL